MGHTGHTPLPWTATVARQAPTAPAFGYAVRAEGRRAPVACAGIYQPEIVVGEGEGQYSPEEVEANAALIVRAVNNHAALVAYVRRSLADMEADGIIGGGMMDDARSLLEKLEV